MKSEIAVCSGVKSEILLIAVTFMAVLIFLIYFENSFKCDAFFDQVMKR